MTILKAKGPLQPIEEVLSLCSEGSQAVLHAPEKVQRLEKIFAFLKSSSYCSILPLLEQRLIFSLSSRLPSILSLQSDNLKELEVMGVHFRTVESYRASAASQETLMGEYEAQLSQLQRHSAEIEREIVETKRCLASLRQDLATDQAAINVIEAQLRSEEDPNVSFRRKLNDLLRKPPEMKRRRKKAQRT